MDSMAQKSQMEVPTEFLNTIREEKLENKPATSTTEPQITKKYPFNRYKADYFHFSSILKINDF